jgi:hypothetical protein
MPNNTGLHTDWSHNEWTLDPIKAQKKRDRAEAKRRRVERDSMLTETSRLLADLAVQLHIAPTQRAAKERLRQQEKRIVRMLAAYAGDNPLIRIKTNLHDALRVASGYGMRAVQIQDYCYLYRKGTRTRTVDTLPDVIPASVPDVDIWTCAALLILSREFTPD